MTVVVVGSGIAGLTAALRLAELLGPDAVTVLTKAAVDESNTRYAQGGIAAALAADDSPAVHVADTLAVGCGLNDDRAVRVVCEEGPALVRDLAERWGVPFDRDASGNLLRGLEAAHSRSRVLHAGGDATGRAIVVSLIDAVRAAGVQIVEGTLVLDVVLDRGAVVGVRTLGPGGEEVMPAQAVILATGGLGAIYAATTNPAVATGDGLAIAWRAGAILRDLEFVQFHPTALAVPEHFLVSEAVRGEGAVLLDHVGNRFMQAVHPLAELAPRDVVARGIVRAMAAQSGAPVLLDATGIGDAAALAARFPTIDARVREAGFDWSRQPIPVTPAAHYAMGGVAVDIHGRSSVPGLYAVGEVSSSGLHGANRLASNSLLEGLVYGERAAVDAVVSLSGPRGLADAWADNGLSGTAATQRTLGRTASQPQRASATELRHIRAEIGDVMWSSVGVERDAAGLARAEDTLQRLAGLLPAHPSTIAEAEVQNMVMLAQLVTDSAAARRESRGAHYRADFPGLDPDGPAHHLVQNAGRAERVAVMAGATASRGGEEQAC